MPPITETSESVRIQSAGSAAGTVRPKTIGAASEEGAPFLDMEDEDSVYGSVSGADGTGRLSNVEDGDGDDSAYDGMDEGPDSRRNGRFKRAVVEDFPLPPSSMPGYGQAQEPTGAMNPNSSQLSAQPAQPGTPTSPFPIPTTQPHMTFRALPLLASDLPHTQIQVVNSSNRPNDRGKEVLSFIILVEPGKRKEPWRVEKLYSDVLGLDARVRSSVGKSVIKKMVLLPEGRLWRDHAPAKADQRKVSSFVPSP